MKKREEEEEEKKNERTLARAQEETRTGCEWYVFFVSIQSMEYLYHSDKFMSISQVDINGPW